MAAIQNMNEGKQYRVRVIYLCIPLKLILYCKFGVNMRLVSAQNIGYGSSFNADLWVSSISLRYMSNKYQHSLFGVDMSKVHT